MTAAAIFIVAVCLVTGIQQTVEEIRHKRRRGHVQRQEFRHVRFVEHEGVDR